MATQTELMARAEAYDAAHEPPDPTREDLLTEMEDALDELETMFPNGEPCDRWERLEYLTLKGKVSSAVFQLAELGDDVPTRPTLTVIAGGAR